jgi:type IV secretion system protein VirB10
MTLFSRGSSGSTSTPDTQEGVDEPLEGDRGIPSVNRARSVQSRASSVLAFTLMSALGLGLLTWYYARTLSHPREVQHAAQVAAKNRAQGEMALPSLGRIDPPVVRAAAPSDPAAVASDPGTIEKLLGPAPQLPAADPPVAVAPVGAYPGSLDPNRPRSPGELAFERRLAGPAFAHASNDSGAPLGASGSAIDPAAGELPRQGGAGSAAGDPGDSLKSLLRPTVTPAVTATLLPTRRFLLAKGAFIDCTLETAIDSTLPGMTTCVTATDTFSADGSVVLLERGTKLVGETRGQVAQGAARIFVLWTEARTPTGVVVPLSSPGTDELGRSGLSGEVNRHFWERFGAAILMTVINGTVQGIANSQNNSGSVVVTPSTSTDVMTEVLRSTVSIPPTVTKAQGDRIQVFVARDVDFRSVYTLKVANPSTGDGSP